jgi:CRP/FNR family cyclic AMP-dependent transcriptional regulator
MHAKQPVHDLAVLRQIPLFKNVSDADLFRIVRYLHPLTLPIGTTILSIAEPGNAVYLLLRGTIKIYVGQADGNETILAVLGSGQIVGEMSLLDEDTHSATAVTLETCNLLSIDRASFQLWLHTVPPMALNLARLLSCRLRLANVQIQSLVMLDVSGRVARQLLAFAKEYGVVSAAGAIDIPMRLTQSDLASLVGASRARVNNVLGFYKQQRLIAFTHDHYIRLLDPTELANHCL